MRNDVDVDIAAEVEQCVSLCHVCLDSLCSSGTANHIVGAMEILLLKLIDMNEYLSSCKE